MWTRLIEMTARVRALFRAGEMDREFDQELRSHLAMLEQDNIRRGMTPDEARRAARIRLGGAGSLQQQHREVRGLPFLETVLQDLRYTFRMFRRDTGFTTFAILIVGLGIGASSTVFNVVNALLLRPLPFTDADRLAWIPNGGQEGAAEYTIQVGHFVDLRQRSTKFADLAAYFAFFSGGESKLTGEGEPERLTSLPVTQNFFPMLGVEPQLGRGFTADECLARWTRRNEPKVALLTDALWRRRFNADPNVLGRRIVLNDLPVTIVGVMPASFDFAAVFAPGSHIDLYVPMPLTEEVSRRGNTLAVVGRLKPGATIEQANAELAVLGKQIRREYPKRNGLEPSAISLQEHVSGRFRAALFVLACAVGVVMLIVCANLSNLQLARAASRQKEMAVRVALGAGRRRLLRQLLTENIVLCGAGALLGLALAVAGAHGLSRLTAFSIPLLSSVRVDVPALAFTLLAAVLTGVIVGLVPALQVPAMAVHGALKDRARGSSEGRRHAWIRGALVVAEVALACVLLVGAGLLVRSFVRVLDVDLGFRPARVAALRIDPSATRYTTREQRNAYFDEVLRRVRAIPGISGAGLTDVLPLGGDRSWGLAAQDRAALILENYPEVFARMVSDGYFKTMGIPLKAGRDFTAQDAAAREPVVVINESLARRFWPGQDAVGRMVTQDNGRRVIGVVGDVRHRALETEAGYEMYIPIRQTNDYSEVDLTVRTDLPPASMAASVRDAIRPLDPTLPGNEFRLVQELVDKSVSPRRFVVTLLGGFSLFALVLASLGIYAVISYSVNQRTQELGIRMALGASARDLQGRVIVQTLRLAALGMLIGMAASWLIARAISGLLFGVTATDPATFVGMLVTLTAVALMAGYLPARRASRIDPIAALRAD
jgi:predicted permease